MFRVNLYDRGYSLYGSFRADDKKKVGGGVRGKIEGKLSSSSFRRLRKFCITHDVPKAECWGITLTIPGLDILDDLSFRKIHHKFVVWCNYHHVPLIWRVELQTRGQPHLHCVLFCSIELVLQVFDMWFTWLDSLPFVFNDEIVDNPKIKELVFISRAFVRGSSHAVDLQKLDGDFRIWRYLVAHMSKSKIEQIGWRGRNWGVVNKSMFVDSPCDGFEVSERSFFMIRRWVRRLTLGVPCKRKGRRLNKFLQSINESKGCESKVFYKRRKMRNKTCAYWVGNPDIVRSMMVYANHLSEDIPF